MEFGPIIDMDFGRMYDQYMHKGNQNFDLSLSAPNSNSHITYMADQSNSYASFESSNNNNGGPTTTPDLPQTYTDLSNMTPHENSHTPVSTHMMQPHQQPVYQQLGVPPSMHDGSNVQFPPQNLYIPSISQPGQGLVPHSSGFMGQGMDHSNVVYTNAGPGMHGQQLGHLIGSHMMPNPYFPRPQMIRSGSSPNSGGSPSPGSEDSDDSNTQAQGMKRPSPEIIPEAVIAASAKGKKARVSKKSKKKKDPNEPQKPVSAYALFFRDTQASIKGQNPNASFGEVSKIVASMWDSLDSEQKNAYKRKTEAAKKEYLKKLAAYRATLVSKGEGESNVYPGNQPYGQMQPGANYGYSVTTSTGPHVQGHSPPQLSPLAKKSPMLTPMMTDSQMNPPMSQPMPPSNPSMMGPMSGMASMGQTQIPTQSPHQSMVQGPHLSQMTPVPPSSPYMTQANPALSSPVSDVGSPVGHSGPQSNQQSQQQKSPPQNHLSMGSNPSSQHNGQQMQNQMCNTGACLRAGCNNPAVNNPEWEEEYCSNECVVSHCRDVFGNWVSTNQQNAPIYPAPVK